MSLPQTNPRMNVLEDALAMMRNPSAILTELRRVVRVGATHAFDVITMIRGVMLYDIMPALLTARDELLR